MTEVLKLGRGLFLGLLLSMLLAGGSAVAHQNVINIKPVPDRMWQCGSNFPQRGADQYRYVTISVDGKTVAKYDLMTDEDCRRVTTVVRDVPDGAVINVRAKVGNSPAMEARLTAADWPRLWTVFFYVDQIWGDVTEDHYAAPEDDNDQQSGPPPVRWTIPGGDAEQQVVDTWNTAACGYTDRAVLEIDRPMFLSRIQLWVDWDKVPGSDVTDYRVSLDGQPAGGGLLRRGDCDPYQRNWCTADDSPKVKLVPGRYVIRMGHKAICQNAGSGGQGFIRAWDP